MDMKTEKSYRLTALAIAGILSLTMLFSTSYLYIDNGKLTDVNLNQKFQIENLFVEKNNLIAEISQLNKNLEENKAGNAAIQNLYSKSKSELKARNKRIEKLSRENAGYSKLLKEVKGLREFKSSLYEKIKVLEKQNNLLLAENNTLRKQVEEYKKALEELRVRYDILGEKVALASELKADRIYVIPVQKLNKASSASGKRIKRSDKLFLVCKISENKIADKGEKVIYIRIVDPKGALVDGTNSGAFMNKDQNLEVPYTTKETINYNNADLDVKIPISLNRKELPKGSYKVEMYCDGYFCGGSVFNLK
jgi:hypothetical protein